MEQYQKELAKHWGWYMRTPWSAYPRRSVLGRLKEEAWGASSGGVADYVPKGIDCPPEVLFIHRSWRKVMSEQEAKVFFVQFVAKGSPKAKAEAVGLKQSRYYEVLTDAMGKLPWPKSDRNFSSRETGINAPIQLT